MPPGRVPRLTRGRRPNTSGLTAAVAGCSLALQAVGGGGEARGQRGTDRLSGIAEIALTEGSGGEEVGTSGSDEGGNHRA